MPNPLQALEDHGQSFWLDNLTRGKLESGELSRRVTSEGLRGVTSNPAIFHKALAGDADYGERIARMAREGLTVRAIYERIVTEDVRDACDVLAPVHVSSEGRDGFVSLEVSPWLAYDPVGTVEEARRLWRIVDRENLMIKIPGTRPGLAAIEQSLYEGINVNVTLLFSVERYRDVVAAWLSALRRRHEEGRPVERVASVASFFLSRIDVMVDRLLGHRIRPGAASPDAPAPQTLLGRAALVSARAAYEVLERMRGGGEWSPLAQEGAGIQRLLWASTSNKNPLYDDLRYVEPLIGPDTINTMPDRTAATFLARGVVRRGLPADPESASDVVERLEALGVDLEGVADRLEAEGAQKFIDPFDRLVATISVRRREALDLVRHPVEIDLSSDALDLEGLLQGLQEQRVAARIFGGDATLWHDAPPSEREVSRLPLGWLGAPERFLDHVDELAAFADEVRDDGFGQVLWLGMGGSSGTARVVLGLFEPSDDRPGLRVLDDTDPGSVEQLQRTLDPKRTLVVVASKSGTTEETMRLYRAFTAWLTRGGVSEPGRHLVAITDEDTPLASEASEGGFRRTFVNPSDIGGRYSALSYFGLVPMALIGVDVEAVLDAALKEREGSSADVPARVHPALRLGAALGAFATRGRDKVTLRFAQGLDPLGPWIRQLLAESTGKDGTGLVPILDEPMLPPEAYGNDRVFVYVVHEDDEEGRTGDGPGALASLGHPEIVVRVRAGPGIGADFMRWELATAAAGHVLGVDPFDQPDVESTKRRTRELLEAPAEEGEGPTPVAAGGAVEVYAPVDAAWVEGDGPEAGDVYADLRGPDAPEAAVATALARFLVQARPGGVLALLPFFPSTPRRDRELQALRYELLRWLGVATTLEHGPAYLHATGQLHKGGPAGGLYVVLTADAEAEPGIFDQENGLVGLHRAQPLADVDALAERGRQVVRIHLGKDPSEGLRALVSIARAIAAGVARPGRSRSVTVGVS